MFLMTTNGSHNQLKTFTFITQAAGCKEKVELVLAAEAPSTNGLREERIFCILCLTDGQVWEDIECAPIMCSVDHREVSCSTSALSFNVYLIFARYRAWCGEQMPLSAINLCVYLLTWKNDESLNTIKFLLLLHSTKRSDRTSGSGETVVSCKWQRPRNVLAIPASRTNHSLV